MTPQKIAPAPSRTDRHGFSTIPDHPLAVSKFNDYAKPQKVAVRLASHLQGEHIEWLEAIRQNPNGPNAYLYSEERFGRYLDIMVECARARVAALEYTAP